jgi:uncharacterized protein
VSRATAATAQTLTLATRIASLEWDRIEAELAQQGSATVSQLLTAEECAALVALYGEDASFRSTIVMARHNFGRGEYRYFDYPLPEIITVLRTHLYAHLAPLANRWSEQLGDARRFPPAHGAYIERCHAAGQRRPTPLLLRYREGDYNCLHRDLYGEQVFPFQATLLLSRPGRDFEGGEFVLVEQRPRMQSRADVVPLDRGDCVLFAVHERPVRGTRGFYRVQLRHGVSRVRRGLRHTAGIIFHDAT